MTHVERFAKLFRGRENCHGRYLDGENKKVWTAKGPVPEDAWQQHLDGEGPYLGVVPIMQDNQCYFGAIDVDDDGIDLVALARAIAELDLPLITCRSKSGGAHLYLFLRDPAPAKLVSDKLTQWARALGHTHNHDGRPVEIFPKQTRLTPAATGNWINLPYYNAGDTNRYAVDPDLGPLSLEEFLLRAEAMAVTSIELATLSPKGEDQAFADGPPCLQTLHQIGYPAGSRNQGLYNVGVYLKLAHPDEWKERLAEYNAQKMDPPLSEQEVEGVAKSLERRDYVFMCEQLPISAHCQKGECKKRRFGLGGFRKKAIDAAFPELSELTKILTDPPQWTLLVNGTKVELTTDDLMSIARFRKAVLEKLSIIVPMVKVHEWDEKLVELLESHKVVEAPEDAGTAGQFRVMVHDFLMLRTKADQREDLLRGVPYEENGRVYFRSQDLAAFLDRRRFKEYSLSKVFTALRSMGAGHTRFNVKGAGLQVWWLPVPDDEQKEDFDPPVPPQPQF